MSTQSLQVEKVRVSQLESGESNQLPKWDAARGQGVDPLRFELAPSTVQHNGPMENKIAEAFRSQN